MTHFAMICRYIVTVNADGSVPLNSKVAATFSEGDDRGAAEALIAQANCAPDMLAALKTIADFYREGRDCSGHPMHPIARADAAIAKASQESRP